MYMYVHLYIDDLQQGIFLKNIKHCTSKCQKCAPKPHFPHILCRMQGICKCTLGITSVRIPLLIKRDKLYLPGPAHYHQQSEPQGEQQGGGGGRGQQQTSETQPYFCLQHQNGFTPQPGNCHCKSVYTAHLL